MTSNDAAPKEVANNPFSGMSVRNLGEPLRFKDVEALAGFAVGPGQGGQTVKVCTRLFITSDDPLFHRLAENFARVINHLAQQAGTAVSLDKADTVLFIIKADNTAELWIDNMAIGMRCAVKRAVAAGTAVMEEDIADITGMNFPAVTITDTDKVFCTFRKAWRFGMAFDFNPDGKLDIERFTTDLGSMYREVAYLHIYDALANTPIFSKLVDAGWFPFVEIISGEFKELLQRCEGGLPLQDAEDAVIARFNNARLQKMLDRWLTSPHLAKRAAVLKSAIESFNRQDPVAAIKTLLTEIEGILNDAFRASKGVARGTNVKELLTFAFDSAVKKAGRDDTLFFAAAFYKYLNDNTFANFDPKTQSGTAGSRHAVGHGAADPASYTMTSALQAILTVDQLFFFT